MKSQERIDLKSANTFIAENIDIVLSYFGINLNYTDSYLVGSCPIHGGDNTTAFNIFTSGHSHIGNWICYTHHCEKSFVNNSIGFIRGLLSHQKYNWSKNGDKTATFSETLKLINTLYDLSIDKNKKTSFKKNILESSVFSNTTKEKQNQWSKYSVRKKLSIPSKYYISRGYSEDCLNKYDVGDSNTENGIFKDRAIVPVYDIEGKYVIGFTGRTKFDKCNNCNHFHAKDSLCDSYHHISKWCHNKGFCKKEHLYNYHNALKYIRETGMAILVEGPGDVWRLEESGIHNSLAVFGSSLTDSQQILLEASGALTLILLFDSDEAGTKASDNVQSSLSRMFKILKPSIPNGYKDIGEMNIESINHFLKPILEKI